MLLGVWGFPSPPSATGWMDRWQVSGSTSSDTCSPGRVWEMELNSKWHLGVKHVEIKAAFLHYLCSQKGGFLRRQEKELPEEALTALDGTCWGQ